MNKGKIGFTLIELLVVIAILAAILFPVFAKAREKARQTTCVSNLKQLGLGFIQYCQDYDEYFPGSGAQTTQDYSGEQWAWQIYPYEKSNGVYVCPVNISLDRSPVISYAYNLDIGAYQGETTAKATGQSAFASNKAKLASPTQTALLFEFNYGYRTESPVTSYDTPSQSDGTSVNPERIWPE